MLQEIGDFIWHSRLHKVALFKNDDGEVNWTLGSGDSLSSVLTQTAWASRLTSALMQDLSPSPKVSGNRLQCDQF